MIPALSYASLKEQVNVRYEYDEKRIVGIMLARYDIKLVKDIINENYAYWHCNAGKMFDVFWAGYGEYIYDDIPSKGKIVLSFPNNSTNVHFDLNAFVSIKNEFNKVFSKKYRDRIQLALVNYHDGKLRFDESVQIDLEKNMDSNFASIRELMELIIEESRCASDVQALMATLNKRKLLDSIKGITLTDAINLALSTIGIAIK